MLLKSVMVRLDKDTFNKRYMLEFMSLVLADLPYKFLYFILEDLTTAFLLLLIKFSYKLFKDPFVLSKSMKIQSLKNKLAKKEDDPEKPYFVMGYATSQTKEILSEISAGRLFFHTFNSILTTMSLLMLFALSRLFNVPFFSDLDDEVVLNLTIVF